jgi:hypothetical protein
MDVIPESAQRLSGIYLEPLQKVDPGQLAGASFRDDTVVVRRGCAAARLLPHKPDRLGLRGI